jgi:hypothetical protein
MSTGEISVMVAIYYVSQVLSCYSTGLRIEVHTFLNALSVFILVIAWIFIGEPYSGYLIAMGGGLGKAEYLGQTCIDALDAPPAKKRKACSCNLAARCTGAIVGYVLGGQLYCADSSYNLLLGVSIILSSLALAQELLLLKLINSPDKASEHGDSKRKMPVDTTRRRYPNHLMSKSDTANDDLRNARRRLSVMMPEALDFEHLGKQRISKGRDAPIKKKAPVTMDELQKVKVAYTIASSYFVYGTCYGVAQFAIPIRYAALSGAAVIVNTANTTALAAASALSASGDPSTAVTTAVATANCAIGNGICGVLNPATVSGVGEMISVILTLYLTKSSTSTGPTFTMKWGFALSVVMVLLSIQNGTVLIGLHIFAVVGLNMVWGGLSDVLLGYSDAINYKKTLSIAIAGQLTGAAIGGSVLGVLLYSWNATAPFVLSGVTMIAWNVYYADVVIQRLLSLNNAQLTLLARSVTSKSNTNQPHEFLSELQTKWLSSSVRTIFQNSPGRANIRRLLTDKKASAGNVSDTEIREASAVVVQQLWRSYKANQQLTIQIDSQQAIVKAKAKASPEKDHPRGRALSLITFEKRFKEMLASYQLEL